MKTLRKNDKGVALRLRIKDDDTNIVDISSATTKSYIFNKPDRTTVTKTADFYTDGVDGILTYTTESSFLNTIGIWEMQAYVIIGTAEYRSNLVRFKVEDILV